MKITIAADPGGVALKDAIKTHLETLGHQVSDKGTIDKSAPVLYPVVGDVVAKDIQSGAAELGMVFCGTGMGVSIVANKHKGVYCAVVESVYAAYHSREINNANVLALGGNIVGTDLGIKIVDTFLGTRWKADADEARGKRLEGFFDSIQAIEQAQFKD